MASVVSVANLALTILGADRITSLDDGSENARRITNVYYSALEDVLRIHPWNFAIARSQLGRLASTPLFEYDYEYQLPADYLRVITVSDGTNIIEDYKVEGKKLLCDYTTVKIKYIKNTSDANQYTSQFIYVLANRIAAEIAYAVTNNKVLAEEMFKLYQSRLQTAKEADAQESDSVHIIDQDLWAVDKRL